MALALLLIACQPFLSVHFDDDGLVAHAGLDVRSAGGPVQFLPDADAPGPLAFETKLFVPAAANIHLPGALLNGIAALLCLVALLVPLRVIRAVLLPRLADAPQRGLQGRGGAPPPTRKPALLWHRRWPTTAPPY
jgi:hypothetical protein